MTFPELLPDTLPVPDTEPDVSHEQQLTRDRLRIFRIGSPLATHFIVATCAELNCPEFLYGFRVECDSETAIGQQQIAYIQASSLQYVGWWSEDGTVTFIISRGQNGLNTHWRRLSMPGNYVTVNGNDPPAGSTAADWLTNLGNHLTSLRNTQDATIQSGQPWARTRKVPLLNRDTEAVAPANGYELTVGPIPVSGRTTSINLAMPLDASDASRPLRLSALADFSLVLDGIRDRGSGITYRRLSGIVGREVSTRLQVGQLSLSFGVRFTRYTFYRPAPDTVAWRLVGRLAAL